MLCSPFYCSPESWGLVVSFWWWGRYYIKSSASGVLWNVLFMWIASFLSLQDPLGSFSHVCQHKFYTFLSSSVWAPYYIWVYGTWCLMHYVRYYFFVLFITAKTSLVQVPVCLSLTDHGLVVHSCRISRAKPCPISYPLLCLCTSVPRPVSLLLKASVIPHLPFSMLYHYSRVVNIFFYIEQLLASAIYIKL